MDLRVSLHTICMAFIIVQSNDKNCPTEMRHPSDHRNITGHKSEQRYFKILPLTDSTSTSGQEHRPIRDHHYYDCQYPQHHHRYRRPRREDLRNSRQRRRKTFPEEGEKLHPYNPNSHPHSSPGSNFSFTRLTLQSQFNGDDINSTHPSGEFNQNSSTTLSGSIPRYNPMPFKVVGSFFVGLVFLIGVGGNVMVVLVVVRMRSMHTPTNCYLMSLAVADLLLLLFACLPTLVEFFVIQDRYMFGWLGCKLMVFFQYLSVNLSSLSITAFTIERYVAVCHPIIAHRVCTVRRANKIIVGLWLFGLAYCSPWLVLISLKVIEFEDSTAIETCTFNLNRSHYAVFYMADLFVFYLVPLFLNSILYIFIGKTLYETTGPSKSRRALSKEETTLVEMVASVNGNCSEQTTNHSPPSQSRSDEKFWIKQHHHQHHQQHPHDHGIKITSHVTVDSRNRIQVIKMLAVVVAMFAVLWLPYRAYVVYNSFARRRFECEWCMLTCRLMIYTNSAINPILYNAMSSKFRRSFLRLLFFRSRRYSNQNFHMRQIHRGDMRTTDLQSIRNSNRFEQKFGFESNPNINKT